MATLGGGPPLLSLLTGVAQGVSRAEEKKAERERQAILNRLRESQIETAQQSLELRRQQEERLREQESRRRAEAGRAHVQGILEKAQEIRERRDEEAFMEQVVDLRANELRENFPESGVGELRLRARADLEGLLEAPEPPSAEDDPSPMDVRRTRENRLEANVSKILDTPELREEIINTPDIEGISEIAQRPEVVSEGFSFDELQEAWERTGTKDAAREFDRSQVATSARLTAEQMVRFHGSPEAAVRNYFVQVGQLENPTGIQAAQLEAVGEALEEIVGGSDEFGDIRREFSETSREFERSLGGEDDDEGE